MLQHCLEQFEYKSLEDVTVEGLKKEFKKKLIQSHPDKGGKEEDFEKVTSDFMFLSEILYRISGGRSSLQSIHPPEDIKEQRNKDIIYETSRIITEVYDLCESSDSLKKPTLPSDFHKLFEELNIKESHELLGYQSWLADNTTYVPPKIVFEHFHKEFESSLKKSSNMSFTHPEEMAICSGTNLGMNLIHNEDSFTSVYGSRLEYTDLYSAYTTNNTIYDKIPTYEDCSRTFEQVLEERNKFKHF